jgi:hypothetical protein
MTALRVAGSALLLGIFGSTAYASLTCLPGTFATIDQVQATNETCTANNTEQFSNFLFTSQAKGTTALNPADVAFQILQGDVGPYLVFPQTFSVMSPPTGDNVSSFFTLAYSVSALNNMVITGFDGHVIGAAQHHGTSGVSIDYCAGGPVASCPTGQGGVLNVDWITSKEFVTLPSGVGSLNFLVTGTIDSPDQGSNASMTSFEMGIQTGSGGTVIGVGGVPEPGTELSVCLGLLLLGIGLRGRLRRS